jgi:hypothetical protein
MILDEARVTDLHRRAVDLAHQAATAGDAATALRFRRDAYAREREAAELLTDAYEIEPTRAILFKGAASLALQCKEFREAERLIAKGLSGNPPHDIAHELRMLMEWAQFDWHLALQNIVLEPNDFQLSVAGPGVAPEWPAMAFLRGFALFRDFFCASCSNTFNLRLISFATNCVTSTTFMSWH